MVLLLLLLLLDVEGTVVVEDTAKVVKIDRKRDLKVVVLEAEEGEEDGV